MDRISPDFERLYRSLYRIRRVEVEIAKDYPSDKIKSPVHLSIGQEAVSVAVCEALGPGDLAFGTYRGHALYLAKGGDLRRLIAELYGKATGCAKGKGGSMHLIDTEVGLMGTSAVVGTTIANAVGYAYALKCRRENRVVVSLFGDGATEEGVFHESLNFAALKGLPIVFICENNGYAIHTPQWRRQARPDIAGKAAVCGMPAETIAEGDLLAIHERVSAAVRHLRAGRPGPFFFECQTYRWKEHVGPSDDCDLGYRAADELRRWVDNDPLPRLGALVEDERRRQIECDVESEIIDAFAFAESSPWPATEELYTDVFQEA
jgi:TPP-dependent pyruvate/acetoin dehydrogenase alpha subunit